MITLSTHGADETERLGAAIASVLEPGDVVALHGDLGVGKTTLVRAAARYLGVDGHVTSPSFAVAQRYDGSVPVAHLDAYRLDGADAEDVELLHEVAEGAVVFIEWPDALEGAFGPPVVSVALAHAGGDLRNIVVTSDARRETEIRAALDPRV